MSAPAKLILTLHDGQDQEFALTTGDITLGRAAINDIIISFGNVADPKVSRSHARLEYTEESYTLVDLNSSNGTYVNDERIESAVLAPGDLINIGDSTLRFETTPSRDETMMTLINSKEDLEKELAETRLNMMMSDTRSSRLVVHTLGKTWEVTLTEESYTIGRQDDNDILLDEPEASRQHARIERVGDAFILRDLDSTNGSWFMGASGQEQRVDKHTLQDSDTIRIGEAKLVFKSGFQVEHLTMVGGPLPLTPSVRRPVIVVPGFGGSELWLGSERLWPNTRMLLTNPEVLRLTDKPTQVEVRGILGDVVIVPNLIKLEQYSRLGDYLEEGLDYERGNDLLEFGYDWRFDVRQSAQRLAEAVDNWNVKPPITIIAHSLGCLVSRYYVEHLNGHKKIGRLLLMGGPHTGVPKTIVTLLLGAKMLPFGLMGERMREVLATFPSMYQTLPTDASVFDQHGKAINVLSDETWLPDEQRRLLRIAREFRKKLGMSSRVPAVSIFGYGLDTVNRITVERDADGRPQKVDVSAEPGGDDSVPQRSTVLPGSEIHPVEQNHGALYVDNDVRMRLKLELMK